jgi:hypothetical protein
MRRVDLYGPSVRPGDNSAQPGDQAVSQPASAARDTAPKPPTMASHAVAISWVGVLIALILLRILYEFGE